MIDEVAKTNIKHSTHLPTILQPVSSLIQRSACVLKIGIIYQRWDARHPRVPEQWYLKKTTKIKLEIIKIYSEESSRFVRRWIASAIVKVVERVDGSQTDRSSQDRTWRGSLWMVVSQKDEPLLPLVVGRSVVTRRLVALEFSLDRLIQSSLALGIS